MQRRSLQRIGKTLRRSHRPIVRWLSGALLAWLLLLGVGVPLAAAQTGQSPESAPANTAPVDTAAVERPSSPVAAAQTPTLTTGVSQKMNGLGSGLGLLAATGLAIAGTQLVRARATPAQAAGPNGQPSGLTPAPALVRSASSVTVAQARQTTASPASRVETIGGNLWGDIRRGIINQLRLEAPLNQAHAGEYAQGLGRLAENIESGRVQLPNGAYQRVRIRKPYLASNIQNPLEIDPFTGDPVARIEQYNRDIADLREQAAFFQRWGMSNSALGLEVAAAQLEIERNMFINNARLQDSRSENGNVYRALGEGVDPNATPVIFINGINTDTNRAALQAQEPSNLLKSPINHVVNVSSMDKLARAGLGITTGNIPNLEHADLQIQQHLTGNRPAATAAANLILDQLYATPNTPVKLIGYSQGAGIGAQALRAVESILAKHVAEGRITSKKRKKC
jgi:hypothetical protein